MPRSAEALRRPISLLSVILTALLLQHPTARAEDRPAEPKTKTDAACSWVWTEGDGISLWTEACKLPTGSWAVKWKDTIPGFELEANGQPVLTVVHVLKKPADAPLRAVLPSLIKAGLIPDTPDCVLKPAVIKTRPPGTTAFEIRPEGARLKALESTPQDEVPEPPCGDYGWSTHGIRYVLVNPSHPDTVVYVDEGQDGTMIAPETIRLR